MEKVSFKVFVNDCIAHSFEFFFMVNDIEYHFNYENVKYCIYNDTNDDVYYFDTVEEVFSKKVFSGKCLLETNVECFYR